MTSFSRVLLGKAILKKHPAKTRGTQIGPNIYFPNPKGRVDFVAKVRFIFEKGILKICLALLHLLFPNPISTPNFLSNP